MANRHPGKLVKSIIYLLKSRNLELKGNPWK